MPISRSKKTADTDTLTEPKIVVTAQQSRFHEVDDPASKDIEVNDLSITIGKREILQHTRLVLKAGLRYVFVGRNGLGKSTVLEALAERRIPGIATNLRMLLLDQTMVENAQKGNSILAGDGKDLTVLENVVASDRVRQRLLDDTASLSAVLQDGPGGTSQVVQVYRRLKLERAQRDLEEARLIAKHRSGARGSKARQVELEREAAVKEATQLADNTANEEGTDEVDAAVSMLESLQLNLEAMGSASIEARARTAMIGLGFSVEQIEGPMSKLSGGWQTRAALAAALIQKTDILMLDEPTNFLDLPAVIWLQHYLTTDLANNTTLVVTTHDRDFADAVAERLMILRVNPACTLETFNGTLSNHDAEKRRQIRRMTKMSDALDKKKEHMQSTIQKSAAAAKRSGDDKKLKQAASRKKKLEERTGLEVSAKGTRFKLNRDLAGYHLTARGDIEIPEFDPLVTMTIPEQPPELRNPGSLVSLENVSFTYKKAKKPTLNNIDLIVQPGSRTALVGLNGSGKSTFVNVITSDFSSPSTSPGVLLGTLTLHPQARIAHYTQHETSRLLEIGQANPQLTPLGHLQARHPSIQEQPLRALLSGLSLPSQTQANTPLSALSGGQLVRVAFATCFLPTPPHLLILDEPTTHLDSDSIVALIQALKTYAGAIIVVSHDRFFVRCVVEGQSVKQASTGDDVDQEAEADSSDDEDDKPPGKVYRLTRTSGRMIELTRGMDEYEEVVVRQLAKQGIEV
ncbi:hypothetical protein PMZ80_008893 [Knufia obscura]|uniref:ABC transporter domain-containing protein n=1 Tax=Knufia obscura TaxID=1635080 RepID=A0ABR0RDJ7_9EURO|nr:hypothetical protein PMZ80_008893 [Knufia obscura]